MKKIIFFDGDGTLWYPKTTRYRKAPHWIYHDPKVGKSYNKHLMLTPTALSTLKELRERGIILVVLSTHPHPPEEADAIIRGKIKHFQLGKFFDEVHATREYHGSKGEFMVKILQRWGIPKSKALIVGDKYNWDYKPAKENGIDAVLIESDYGKVHPQGKRVRRRIQRLKDIFNYI